MAGVETNSTKNIKLLTASAATTIACDNSTVIIHTRIIWVKETNKTIIMAVGS
jgi:hypothetical protein